MPVKVPVKRYEMDESASWEERYRKLEAHHLEETTWLIAALTEAREALTQVKVDHLNRRVELPLETHGLVENALVNTNREPGPYGKLAIMFSEPQTLICSVGEGWALATVHGDTRAEREAVARWMVARLNGGFP